MVLDDCSTDLSWRIIQGLASLDKRVHTYRNERNMCCGVIEAAMSKACGELIAIAHNDDAWVSTKLENRMSISIVILTKTLVLLE